jgi:RecJ-like exonuclease
MICPVCKGKRICQTCRGKGKVSWGSRASGMPTIIMGALGSCRDMPCPDCHGTGDCPRCDGTGEI